MILRNQNVYLGDPTARDLVYLGRALVVTVEWTPRAYSLLLAALVYACMHSS